MSIQPKVWDEISNLCPFEKRVELETMCNKIHFGEDMDVVTIAYCEESVREMAETVAATLQMNCRFRIIDLNDDSNNWISMRTVLVIDAFQPIKEIAVKYLSDISSFAQLRKSVIVLLTNLDVVPSATACKHNVKVVLEKLCIVPCVLDCRYENESLTDKITKIFVNREQLQCEVYEKGCQFVVSALEQESQKYELEIKQLEDKKTKFDHDLMKIKTYANQLILEVWLAVNRECNARIEKDVNEFSSVMLSKQNEIVKASDLQDLQFYFAPYINYLWGEFMNQETKSIMEAVQNGLNESINRLLDKYKQFFNENVDNSDATPEMISSGSQPICFDIEHFDNTGAIVADSIFKGLLVFLYMQNYWIGLIVNQLYDILSDKIVKIFRHELSDEQKRNLYSTKVYSIFYEDTKQIVSQITDFMMPALEKELKQSMQTLIDQINNNAEVIGNNFLSEIQEVKNLKEKAEKDMNSAKIIKLN